ncbi:unnamed protein product [Tuber melanosporum]|uniref:(Perigord truffle) hypothetical protein n=1 Tax=Tuber melanosporum (strain Mel28) TaxID=656061 RepID=D5GB57_TUBMM|nr:uncharacterized protein GSTUM_00005461001 [Tuber melanosporum]CAZ81750.1 unnamed protein product [Tuber melanosporum]
MSGTGDSQPSTLRSYADSGIAAVQNVIGSLTGNPVDQRQAEDKKAHAELEHDASRAAAKAGPFNLSSSGAATVDNKDRRDGKADQVIGSGKEFVGNVGSKYRGPRAGGCRTTKRFYFGSCQQSYRHHWGRCFRSDWQYPGKMLLTLKTNMIKERLPSAASKLRYRNNRKTSIANDDLEDNHMQRRLWVLFSLGSEADFTCFTQYTDCCD